VPIPGSEVSSLDAPPLTASPMQRAQQYAFLAKDFWAVVRGKDYFHRSQPLGAYFSDVRCYYNDLTAKADWTGHLIDDVPAVRIPALGRFITLPVTVVQFGLGSMDRYHLTGAQQDLNQVRSVIRWILNNLKPEGYFDNFTALLNPHERFFSNNHGMVQGETLSLCIRVVENHLVDSETADQLAHAIRAIAQNMVLPIEEGGTLLTVGNHFYLCEFPRTDRYVVLNGWVFGLFGLIDYLRYSGDSALAEYITALLRTFRTCLKDFLLADGWSYYDNHGRVCSPFYHSLHISLLDALHQLTGDQELAVVSNKMRAADTRVRRYWYTSLKVLDRLTDKWLYVR
jgi:heparosan-N-sulfate-glucuronate 5-epimerase